MKEIIMEEIIIFKIIRNEYIKRKKFFHKLFVNLNIFKNYIKLM